MPFEDLDREAVVSMYDASHDLHERRWDREGYRSYHHGFYNGVIDEAGAAAEPMIAGRQRRLKDPPASFRRHRLAPPHTGSVERQP